MSIKITLPRPRSRTTSMYSHRYPIELMTRYGVMARDMGCSRTALIVATLKAGIAALDEQQEKDAVLAIATARHPKRVRMMGEGRQK